MLLFLTGCSMKYHEYHDTSAIPIKDPFILTSEVPGKSAELKAKKLDLRSMEDQ